MRTLIHISILLLCTTVYGNSQDRFIRAYDLGYPGITFHNILLHADTLVAVGSVKHPTQEQWGLLFVQMDTLGNVLNHQTHFDSLGDHYIFESSYGFIKTQDGGYACVGQLFSRNNIILVKLNHQGERVFIKDYPDDTVLNMVHRDLVETVGGSILSVGSKQRASDGKTDGFIMKTDIEGNKQWEILYGEEGLTDSFSRLYKINENEYFSAAGSVYSGTNVSWFNAWKQSGAIKVDTLGNILWEWEGEQMKMDSSYFFFPVVQDRLDGNWLELGNISYVLDEYTVAWEPAIVKRDTQFNIIWSTTFDIIPSINNRSADIVQTEDDGWVMAGTAVYADANLDENVNPAGGYIGGLLVKVNNDGDSLWMRVDTLFASHPDVARGSYSKVLTLPSGDIVAAGTLNRYSPLPAQSFGLLLKVDTEGCIEPGCHLVSDATNMTNIIESVQIYPNPTTSTIQVKIEGTFDLALYDNNGVLLSQKEKVHQAGTFPLNAFPPGVYFIKLTQGNKSITKKVVKQ